MHITVAQSCAAHKGQLRKTFAYCSDSCSLYVDQSSCNYLHYTNLDKCHIPFNFCYASGVDPCCENCLVSFLLTEEKFPYTFGTVGTYPKGQHKELGRWWWWCGEAKSGAALLRRREP